MPQLVDRFFKDTSGATAIEYGLIAAGIAGVIIPVVNGFGQSQHDVRPHFDAVEVVQAIGGLVTAGLVLVDVLSTLKSRCGSQHTYWLSAPRTRNGRLILTLRAADYLALAEKINRKAVEAALTARQFVVVFPRPPRHHVAWPTP